MEQKREVLKLVKPIMKEMERTFTKELVLLEGEYVVLKKDSLLITNWQWKPVGKVVELVNKVNRTMNNNFDRIEVKLFKGNMPVREIEFKRDSGEIIVEAINFYLLNAEKFEEQMLEKGSQRMRNSAFYLKRDLQEVKDILYGR